MMKRFSVKKLIALIAVLSVIAVMCFTLLLLNAHKNIISGRPDSSNWVLANDTYKVIPEIDNNVTFTVVNQQGEVVFTCEESWRSRDFKSLSICDDNTIIADSSDTGKAVYKYENGTWINEQGNLSEE